MRLRVRLAKASLRTLSWSLILLAGGVFVLLRTALGHEVVLNWIVAQADARVAGSIDVGSIRSGGILSGARLVDVHLRTPEGETFLIADSVGLSYSVRGLLGGRVAFRDVAVWGAEVDLEWSRDLEGSTLDRFSASPRPGAPAADADDGPTVRVDGLELRDVLFRLRRPTDMDPDGVVRVVVGEERRMALDLELDSLIVSSLEIAPEASGGTRIAVAAAAGRLDLLRETIPIREFSSDLQIAEGRVQMELHALAIPQASAAGDVTVFLGDDVSRRVAMSLDLTGIRGEEVAWIAPWLPPITGSGRLRGSVLRNSSGWTFDRLDARWAGGRIRGSGTVDQGRELSLREMDLRFEGLPVAALSAYLPPVEDKPGTLSGNVRLDGPVDRLGILGRVAVRDTMRGVSTADVSGTLVRTDAGIAFADTEFAFSPLDYPMLDPWVPGLPVAGMGSGYIRLNGRPQEGLRFELDLTQRGSLGGRSHVLAQGSVRADSAGWRVDVQGDVSPFALDALKDRRPELAVRGELSGSFRVNGPLDSLAVRFAVDGARGAMELEGAFDATDPTRFVSVGGTLSDFDLGAFYVPAGDRTVLTGEVTAVMAGWGEAMSGSARVRLLDARLRGVPVDSIVVRTVASGGALQLDTARASLGGFEVDGGGALSLPGVEGEGSLRLRIRSDSLMGLRPAFLGDVVHARDTLRPLDRDILLLSGIDPDTLPLLAEVTLRGTVRGDVVLQGALDNFMGRAQLDLREISFGDRYLEGANLELVGRDLPGTDASVDIALDTDSLHLFDRDLLETRTRAVLTRAGARASVVLRRDSVESYDLAGGVAFDDGQVRIDLDRADLRFGDAAYGLTAPARLAWNDSSLVVRDLELAREGPDEVHIWADGILPRRGAADFHARIRGPRLERVTHLLQRADLGIEGAVDLDLRITGSGEDPTIEGQLVTRGLRVRQFEADSARVVIEHASREAFLDLRAWRGADRIIDGRGTVPVDLALRPGGPRAIDLPMDISGEIRDIEAAPLLALIEDLEDVQGVISGDFTVRGTLDDPVPEGFIRLEDAAWTVGALGVRQSDVTGTFTLTPDGSVAVNARATAGGRVDLSGAVTLSPATNPTLDLELRFQQFQGVDRRDVTGALTGTIFVTGTYVEPTVNGSLSVDRGVLFLDEFQRAVGVVDLTDPIYLGLVNDPRFDFDVDRPLLEGIRNPFLDNLVVNVDLDVPRDTWLRSNEMNVEIGGDLVVTYDRPRRDLVLVGELLARRGQYSVLGRTFEVRGGSVSFIGIPGINPILDIQAMAPIRRQEGGTLEIQATVEGYLVDPRVSLSSDEAGLAESDLVSYLILGRPATELTTQAAGRDGWISSGISSGFGFVGSQLTSLALQRTNLFDYLSVTQVGDMGLTGESGWANSFYNTQMELGWYFGGGDLFGVLVLRPLSPLGGAETNPFGGARIEWQSSDLYHLEAFVEDRFLRSGAFGLQQDWIGQDRLSWGLALFREWGY